MAAPAAIQASTEAQGCGTGVPVVRSVAALRAIVADWRREGARVAVVPTMGALHEGHLSLVRAALSRPAHRVIVTLFVNPKQFGSAADLAAYPRTEREDAAKLAPLGAHLLYVPDAAEMYPDGFATTVSNALGQGLCGAHRAGHFDGVATVVTKLFLQTGADVAFFGEKDFQQLQLVRRMALDLDIPIAVVGCPTVRAPDGLALSSRNVRLSEEERRIAPRLAAILRDAARELSAGGVADPVLAAAKAAVAAAGYGEVEYLELRAEDDLRPLARADRPARLLAAAWLGGTRLIDNVEVRPARPTG
jgi:pantoate--beta-alanine ligase